MTISALASHSIAHRFWTLPLAAVAIGMSACSSSSAMSEPMAVAPTSQAMTVQAPSPDPRVGLSPGILDAGEAIWNLRVVSTTQTPEAFVGVTNSDLAFTGNYAIQGNYNGIQVWDISNPARPTLVVGHVCPASQSDVSVYENLLFVSGEGRGGRLDCGTDPPREAVSHDRLRGIRIFDITNIREPEYIGNVQTCRGSHTHTVLKDPNDNENVYIYVSGSSSVRPAEELAGCSGLSPEEDPNSALFRIEVIRVPLANPAQAAIVNSPRIFNDLEAPPSHGLAPDDIAAIEEAVARGAFVMEMRGQPRVLPARMTQPLLDSIVTARGGSRTATAADSAALQQYFNELGAQMAAEREAQGPRPGPTQCHDITVYPAIGYAGGACGGYGLLLDISDPTDPKRIGAVADSNFSYWHSATFNNDGSKILFTDEWGGGGGPKCRASDPYEWGADAIFTLENREMRFKSYFKLPAAQTPQENCVAHNGSLIPIPGRDVMVQGWYQGGINIFDWTDPMHPVEIAFHDRGPLYGDRMQMAGSWSVYWYNGVIVSSEIARGLDIFELTPSPYLSQNEIDAAKTVKLDYLNAQGQPQFVWPASFSLAKAYVDQLERSNELPSSRIDRLRQALAGAEGMAGSERTNALNDLATALSRSAGDSRKIGMLQEAVRELAGTR